MPLSRAQLERQLAVATDDQAAWEKKLDEKGVAADARKKEPRWRNLDATRRQLKTRLGAVAAVEAREAEAAKRKAGGGEAAGDE